MPEPKYLTLPQYAEAVGKSRRTIQRWLDDGVLVSDLKLPGATGAHLFLAERVGDITAAPEGVSA